MFTALHDTGLELWCLGRGGSAQVRLCEVVAQQSTWLQQDIVTGLKVEERNWGAEQRTWALVDLVEQRTPHSCVVPVL